MAIINNYETFKLIILRFLIQTVNSLDAFSRLILKVRICCTFDQNQNSSWKTIDEIITTNLLVCTEIVRLWLTFAHCAFESLKHKVKKWLKSTKCKNDSNAQSEKVSQLLELVIFALCAFDSLFHFVQKWLKSTMCKSESNLRTSLYFTLCKND